MPCGRPGLGAFSQIIGKPNANDVVEFWCDAKPVFSRPRAELQKIWSETSWRIARLRDNPECADAEYARADDLDDRGLSMALSFDPADDIAAPFIATGARPRVAILREQGVNSQTEMAYAFHRAGFASVDVHMTDLIEGRQSLADFKGVVACGGFSYGDVLGAGGGWAKTILHNPKLAEMFIAFFGRTDSFALGVCNGCQMMSHLRSIIPGARDWPRFERNASEQFEGRLVLVEIPRVAIALLRRHGRQPHSDRQCTWRRARGVRLRRSARPGDGRHALRRFARPGDRALSVQPERFDRTASPA